MPTISSFYGILIIMHLRGKEHEPPHIHARYSGVEATFSIDTGEILLGIFPQSGAKLVKQFILLHKEELLEMWNTQIFKKLPPLE